MTDRLLLAPRHHRILTALLQEHLPDVEVWAYGSRVNGRAHDGSDLDLVLRGPGLKEIPAATLAAFREAVRDSTIPILVDAQDWARLPETFRRDIEERLHVVFREPLQRPMWPVVPFGSCAVLVKDTVSPRSLPEADYVGLEHIGKGTLSLLSVGSGRDVTSQKNQFRDGDILFGGLRPYFRKLFRPRFDGICSTDIWVVRPTSRITGDYLYYTMASHGFVSAASQGSQGTKMPRAKWEHVVTHPVPLPSLREQKAIAQVLRVLDDKIELNRRMNETLEGMTRALFKSWFVDFDPVRAKMEGRDTGLPPHIANLFPNRLVECEMGDIPEGWESVPLDAIARFQNGLALQKYRPAPHEGRLPVVKIAQMRAGKADGDEWASANIKPACIIDDGDVLFSWSGSLLVRIWCGGRAALNQHLFKVTSARYPKWFYRQVLLSHLPAFRDIARDRATTMGHIRRHHMTDALCAVPDDATIAACGDIMSSLLERQVVAALACRTLSAVRDVLLPALTSGDIRVSGFDTGEALV